MQRSRWKRNRRPAIESFPQRNMRSWTFAFRIEAEWAGLLVRSGFKFYTWKEVVPDVNMADEEEDPPFEEDTEDTGGGPDGGQGKRKRLFSKELRCMMYGFGDDQNPYTESVDILEDLVIEFITEMTHKAMSIGRQGRVQVEDIVFLIRKDPRKFARVKDLLTMNEELKRARKAFDEANYGS
uniref:Transcription initiation factor TFIID subunit 13 n=1 Tax=Laticauda laticaudata TaxID=8630 RepID=A0A8C5SHD1_LATLA